MKIGTLLWSTCTCCLVCVHSAFAGSPPVETYSFSPRVGTLIERPEGWRTQQLWKTWSYGFNLDRGWKTSGERFWEAYFGQPEYGLSFAYNHYSNDMYGDNIALFPYLRAPVKRYDRLSFNYSFGLGLAFHMKTWNRLKNPDNFYISSHLTAIIDLSLSADYRVSDKVELYAGGGFTHYSNGATKYPNKGLNGISLFAGIRYQGEPPRKLSFEERMTALTKPAIERKNEIYTFIAPAFIERPIDADANDLAHFFCATLELGYKRQFHPCFKWGAGVDAIYTGNEKYADPEHIGSDWANLSLMTFASIEMMFGDISVNAALGFYPLYTAKPKGNLCERIGVYYNFGNDTRHFAGVSIKATGGSADYIEWTYGYKLFRF